MNYCSNCGYNFERDMNFCPDCGASSGYQRPPQRRPPGSPPQEEYFRKQSWMPMISGFLILVAAIYCFTRAMVVLRIFSYDFDSLRGVVLLAAGLFMIFGFYVGLRAAIYIFQKNNYVYAYFSSFIVIGCGLVHIIVLESFSTNILLFGILGLILLTMSKHEFKDVAPQQTPPDPPGKPSSEKTTEEKTKKAIDKKKTTTSES